MKRFISILTIMSLSKYKNSIEVAYFQEIIVEYLSSLEKVTIHIAERKCYISVTFFVVRGKMTVHIVKKKIFTSI